MVCFSCSQQRTIYKKKILNNSIDNLNVLMNWLEADYQNDSIPDNIALDYFVVIQETKKNLIELKKKRREK